MSTIKVNSIKNTATNDGGIAIDNSGHVQIDGQQLPSAGPLSNRNLVINGAMQINQRGTTTTGGYGGPDRWKGDFNMSGLAIEKSQQQDAPANTGLQKCYQYKVTTAASGSADEYVGFSNYLEFQDIYRAIWANNTDLTVSFWVKSSVTGTFGFSFNPSNVAESTSDSDRRVLYHTTYTISSANTWEYKTITIPMATFNSSYTINDTGADAQVDFGCQLTWVLDVISGGTRDDAALGWNDPLTEARNFVVTSANADSGFSSTTNATWKITGIQFEVGSVATPFEHRSFNDELIRCQRYYTRYDHSTGGMGLNAPGFHNDADTIFNSIFFPTLMRTTGMQVEYSNLSHFDFEPYDIAVTSINLYRIAPNVVTLTCDAASNGSRGDVAFLTIDQDNGFIAFDSEI